MKILLAFEMYPFSVMEPSVLQNSGTQLESKILHDDLICCLNWDPYRMWGGSEEMKYWYKSCKPGISCVNITTW